MKDDDVIQILAGGEIGKAIQIRELIRTDLRFAEIHAEYQEAARAFRHWRDRDGVRSSSAIQYAGMMTEREQELREILQFPTDPIRN